MTINVDLLPPPPKPPGSRLERLLTTFLEVVARSILAVSLVVFWLGMCCLPSALLYVLFYRL